MGTAASDFFIGTKVHSKATLTDNTPSIALLKKQIINKKGYPIA